MIIKRVWFDDENVFIQTDVGRIVGKPLVWFPSLLNATPVQRNNFEIGYYGIHWEELDEDLGKDGFFTYKVDFDYAKISTTQVRAFDK